MQPMAGEDGERVKRLLKAELKRRALTYGDLAEKLTEAGSPHTGPTVHKKITRGGFSAAWFIMCLDVIGCETLRLGD